MKLKRKTVLTIAWALLIAPVFVLILAGCSATQDQYPERLRDSATVRINIVEQLPHTTDRTVIGYARFNGDQCEIWVLDRVYPHAVMHEIMHCFSGNWHEGRKSAEYHHITK